MDKTHSRLTGRPSGRLRAHEDICCHPIIGSRIGLRPWTASRCCSSHEPGERQFRLQMRLCLDKNSIVVITLQYLFSLHRMNYCHLGRASVWWLQLTLVRLATGTVTSATSQPMSATDSTPTMRHLLAFIFVAFCPMPAANASIQSGQWSANCSFMPSGC